jgi:hypothetical protein
MSPLVIYIVCYVHVHYVIYQSQDNTPSDDFNYSHELCYEAMNY